MSLKCYQMQIVIRFYYALLSLLCLILSPVGSITGMTSLQGSPCGTLGKCIAHCMQQLAGGISRFNHKSHYMQDVLHRLQFRPTAYGRTQRIPNSIGLVAVGTSCLICLICSTVSLTVSPLLCAILVSPWTRNWLSESKWCVCGVFMLSTLSHSFTTEAVTTMKCSIICTGAYNGNAIFHIGLFMFIFWAIYQKRNI